MNLSLGSISIQGSVGSQAFLGTWKLCKIKFARSNLVWRLILRVLKSERFPIVPCWRKRPWNVSFLEHWSFLRTLFLLAGSLLRSPCWTESMLDESRTLKSLRFIRSGYCLWTAPLISTERRSFALISHQIRSSGPNGLLSNSHCILRLWIWLELGLRHTTCSRSVFLFWRFLVNTLFPWADASSWGLRPVAGLRRKASSVELENLLKYWLDFRKWFPGHSFEFRTPDRSDSDALSCTEDDCDCHVYALELLKLVLLKAEINEELTVLLNILQSFDCRAHCSSSMLLTWNLICWEYYSKVQENFYKINRGCEKQIPSNLLKHLSFLGNDLLGRESLQRKSSDVVGSWPSRVLLAVLCAEENARVSHELQIFLALFAPCQVLNLVEVRVHDCNGMMNGLGLEIDLVSHFAHPIHKHPSVP